MCMKHEKNNTGQKYKKLSERKNVYFKHNIIKMLFHKIFYFKNIFIKFLIVVLKDENILYPYILPILFI